MRCSGSVTRASSSSNCVKDSDGLTTTGFISVRLPIASDYACIVQRCRNQNDNKLDATIALSISPNQLSPSADGGTTRDSSVLSPPSARWNLQHVACGS
jgi:hypothetical protein